MTDDKKELLKERMYEYIEAGEIAFSSEKALGVITTKALELIEAGVKGPDAIAYCEDNAINSEVGELIEGLFNYLLELKKDEASNDDAVVEGHERVDADVLNDLVLDELASLRESVAELLTLNRQLVDLLVSRESSKEGSSPTPVTMTNARTRQRGKVVSTTEPRG